MKRFFTVFFILLAILFIWLFINRNNLDYRPESRKTVRTIIPQTNEKSVTSTTLPEEVQVYEDTQAQPFIVIENDETFLQAITVDLDKDGASDQICAIKKANDPRIILIPGMQNPLTGVYTRLNTITTGITQARTLMLYTLDLTGEHTNTIVVSGISQDNMQVFAAYLPETDQNGQTLLEPIINLRADGSITIQDINRSDAYNLGLSSGDSYPIYTYNSDTSAPETLDQIESVYRWNKIIKRYTKVSETKVPGKKIESKLVNQLQTGNIDSFQDFLNGLWYMPTSASSNDTNQKTIFFNFIENEIVFFDTNTESIFIKESGASRRYGLYVSTKNSSIPSIKRFIDIELTGIDEIRVKVIEDVQLKITVASSWDGIYRKKSLYSTETQNTTKIQGLFEKPLDSWVSQEGAILKTEANNRYSLVKNKIEETGVFVVLQINGDQLLQLKPDTKNSSTFYRIEAKKNKDTIHQLILTEVKVSTKGVQKTTNQALTWTLNQ